jgi:hypothetical protein
LFAIVTTVIISRKTNLHIIVHPTYIRYQTLFIYRCTNVQITLLGGPLKNLYISSCRNTQIFSAPVQSHVRISNCENTKLTVAGCGGLGASVSGWDACQGLEVSMMTLSRPMLYYWSEVDEDDVETATGLSKADEDAVIHSQSNQQHQHHHHQHQNTHVNHHHPRGALNGRNHYHHHHHLHPHSGTDEHLEQQTNQVQQQQNHESLSLPPRMVVSPCDSWYAGLEHDLVLAGVHPHAQNLWDDVMLTWEPPSVEFHQQQHHHHHQHGQDTAMMGGNTFAQSLWTTLPPTEFFASEVPVNVQTSFEAADKLYGSQLDYQFQTQPDDSRNPIALPKPYAEWDSICKAFTKAAQDMIISASQTSHPATSTASNEDNLGLQSIVEAEFQRWMGKTGVVYGVTSLVNAAKDIDRIRNSLTSSNTTSTTQGAANAAELGQ